MEFLSNFEPLFYKNYQNFKKLLSLKLLEIERNIFKFLKAANR